MNTPDSTGADGRPSAVDLGKRDQQQAARRPDPEHAPPLPAVQPDGPAQPGRPGPGQQFAGQTPPGYPVASGLAMKRRNPLAVWLGLPIITLGIYHLVWYYKIHREMAEFDRRRSIPVAGPMLVVLLLGWTVIAPLVSYHNAGKRIRNAQTSAGLAATCSPTLCWLLSLLFGVNLLYLQIQLNKVVDQYPHASPGTQIPLFA